MAYEDNVYLPYCFEVDNQVVTGAYFAGDENNRRGRQRVRRRCQQRRLHVAERVRGAVHTRVDDALRTQHASSKYHRGVNVDLGMEGLDDGE